MAAPLPPDEPTRVQALVDTGVLDSPPEAAFDDVTRLAATLCGAPIALVSLVDSNRQWFKARVGLEVAETSRDAAFCAHALGAEAPMVVDDALLDPRFRDNPLVLGDPNIRFYAGVPLRVDGGSALGTLCVIDRVPRELTGEQLRALTALARQVARELRLRRDVARLQRGGAVDSRSPEEGLTRGAVVSGLYRVRGPLGQGGMGRVLEVERLADGAIVAMKLLHPAVARQRSMLERFVREARALVRLAHPNVAKVLDAGNDASGYPWLVMERLVGRPASAHLAERGRIPLPEATRWLVDAAAGVAHAHAAHVVHRDLKPSNLFVTEDGAVKVIDFGVARIDAAEEATLTTPELVVGTAEYMAPEQLLAPHEAGPRCDVWSLGVTLYTLVTGRRPWEGSGLEVCSRILTRPPPRPTIDGMPLPPDVETILARCLAKPASERFADASELGAALVALGSE